MLFTNNNNNNNKLRNFFSYKLNQKAIIAQIEAHRSQIGIPHGESYGVIIDINL